MAGQCFGGQFPIQCYDSPLVRQKAQLYPQVVLCMLTFPYKDDNRPPIAHWLDK